VTAKMYVLASGYSAYLRSSKLAWVLRDDDPQRPAETTARPWQAYAYSIIFPSPLCLQKHKSEAEAKFHSMTGPTTNGPRPFETVLVLLPEEFPLRPSQL